MNSEQTLSNHVAITPRVAGVTLIELLVVILVLGILAAVAVPSYQEFVRQASRTEAKGILLETAQFLERNYTVANRYDQDGAGNATVLPCPLRPSPKSTIVGGVCTNPATIRYNIAAAYGAAPAQTYTLTATRAGTMAGDGCGDFTLTQDGAQTLANNAMAVADCWGR